MGKREFVKKIVPFESCDIPAIESWLDDMAKKGLFFQEYGVRRAKFAVSEPGNDTRYRVEYSDVYGMRPTDEKKELYRSCGWEYVDTLFGDLYVFRSDDPDTVELHTEPASISGPLKKNCPQACFPCVPVSLHVFNGTHRSRSLAFDLWRTELLAGYD